MRQGAFNRVCPRGVYHFWTHPSRGGTVSQAYILGVWIALVLGAFLRPVPWKKVPGAIKGTIFLLCLVTCASLMPVEELPNASWVTTFALGILSAVFDNIPLTKLCLDQGHYDWGMLAYTVGFGGSMIWFGSSAGVAITNKFPEGRNVVLWVKKGCENAAFFFGPKIVAYTFSENLTFMCLNSLMYEKSITYFNTDYN
jgi:hypothetical protein